MSKRKRLLVIGPSYRRKKGEKLSAFERYDGLYYRTAKKYISKAKDVDIAVMTDDFVLIDGSVPLPYKEPEGNTWGGRRISAKITELAKKKNFVFLKQRIKSGKYAEIFLSMGKEYAAAMPDISDQGINVLFPTAGGLGPKAAALRAWLLS